MRTLLWRSGTIFIGALLLSGGIFLWSEKTLEKIQEDLLQAGSFPTKGITIQERLDHEKGFRESFLKQVQYLESRDLKRPLNLQFLSDVLDRLSSKYRLSKVGFSIKPLYKKAQSKFEVLQVTLEMESFQDSAVYGFMDALEKNLYGLISPIHLKLSRGHGRRKQAQVSGQYIFSWIGPGEKMASLKSSLKEGGLS